VVSVTTLDAEKEGFQSAASTHRIVPDTP